MKIVHVCIVDAYAENWAYHRNVLSEQNRADGHEVTIITSRYTMDQDGKNERTEAGVSYTESGIKVVRLEDRKVPFQLTKHVNVAGLHDAVAAERPDIIMVHNLQFNELGEVTAYKREHPEVVLCGDNHADAYNSLGSHPALTRILHRYGTGPLVRKNYPLFDRFFYITRETREFFESMYGIDLSSAVFQPLPAPIVGPDRKREIRERIRRRLGLAENQFLFVHSGKLDPLKRTDWIVRALKKTDIDCKVVVIGSIPEGNRESLMALLRSDPRILWLGWLSAGELREYLAAADLYLQPGDQSVTMCNAIAAGTPVMIYPYASHDYVRNGCEFVVESEEDVLAVLDQVKQHPEILAEKSAKCYELADRYFSAARNAELLYELKDGVGS